MPCQVFLHLYNKKNVAKDEAIHEYATQKEVILLMGQLETTFETGAKSIIGLLPQFVSGLAVLLGFLIVAFLIGLAINKLANKQEKSRQGILVLLRKLSRGAVVILGVVTMLGTWGVDVSALVAGLGLTGFALGFAFKDAVSSTLAGMLVLLYQPFKIGDVINVCGVRGEVMSIDMRYTTLQDNTDRHLVPNAKLFTERVSILEKM